MKKHIILAAAFVLTSFGMAHAQNNAQVPASVFAEMNGKFPAAKNVQWTPLAKGVTQAQFSYNGASWVAYFDPAGDIITSGRRIKKVDELPLKVQSGFNYAKGRMEKDGNSSELVIIYEMLADETTSYLVTMRNHSHISTYAIALDGNAVLKLKRPRTPQPVAPANVIAKKN